MRTEPEFQDLCEHPPGSYAGTTYYGAGKYAQLCDVYFYTHKEGSLDPFYWTYCCRFSDDECGDYASGRVIGWVQPHGYGSSLNTVEYITEDTNNRTGMFRMWLKHVGLTTKE
jgi:hypothetical protein